MVKIGATTIGPFQLCATGFLGITTVAGLYLNSQGKKISTTIIGLIALGMCIAVMGFMKTFGQQAKGEVIEDDTDYFEKKKERKDRKRNKKLDAEVAKELQKEAAKAEKAAKVAEKRAKKRVEDARLKALEEEKKAVDAPAPETKTAKKKKKKKKKAAAAEAAPAATEAAPEESPESQGWVVKPNKKEAHMAKKAAQGNKGPIMNSEMMCNPRHFASLVRSFGRIKEAYTVDIQLPRKGSSDEFIRFTGTENDIQTAKDILNELMDKGYSKILDGNKTDTSFKVSNLGLLIGPGGANIRNIQTKTNTRISLPDKEDKTATKMVTIVGDSADVKAAAAAIEMLMSKGFCDLTHDNYVEGEVAFPTSLIGILKGPRGETIQRLQKQTGCRVDVPDQKKPADGETAAPRPVLTLIRLVGPADSVEAARVAMITIQSEHITREMDFPASLDGAFKGTGGSNINRISKATNTRMDVVDHLWDPSQKTVIIRGFVKDIAAVEAEIFALINSHDEFVMDFPTERLGALIQKKGKGIKDLQSRTRTRINVEEHEWDDLVKSVTVVGPKEGVAAARIEIEKMAIIPEPKEREAPQQAQQAPQQTEA